MDYTILIKNIRYFCKKHHKAIGELEKELSVSQGYLSRLNKTKPSFELIFAISKKFECSIDDLIKKDFERIERIIALKKELQELEQNEEEEN